MYANIFISSAESSLNSTIEQFERTISDIIDATQNLSQRTAEQASSLEEIASTIEQATAAISQNTENATKAREFTETGAEKSMESSRIPLEAVQSINEMNDSSQKVVDIISVIDSIAFQTNLLALNAAVEAARAGEQGRGFAVVASEVQPCVEVRCGGQGDRGAHQGNGSQSAEEHGAC